MLPDTPVALLAVMRLQVAEFSRKHREKAQRRRKNAKKGAFEWDTIKREVDDVRILIRALQASPIRSSPVMAEEARAAECLELKVSRLLLCRSCGRYRKMTCPS